MNHIETQVYDALRSFKSSDRLTDLFCSHLNYQYSGNVVSHRGWKERVTDSIRTLQLIGTHDYFHIIFCEIDRLLLGTERPIINQLLKEHPYCLVVFSDPSYQNWHFVNIRYDEEAKNRRLFRRIVIGPDERLHTAAQRISLLDVADERMTALDLQREHDKAFDVEAVTKEFHRDYKTLFEHVVREVRGKESYANAYAFSHLLFNRLMFLYFIQRKGWLKAIQGEGWDKEFMHHLWKYYESEHKKPHSFYRDWLRPLFFEAFKRRFTFNKNLPGEVLPVYAEMPFLNGGLFQEEEDIDFLDFQVADEIFKKLIGERGLLQRYNFTVREDLPLDVEVALDHDMLGTVYESVVNEEERGGAGMFYTPRTEVDFMCRSSIIQVLEGFRILPDEDLIPFVMHADYPEEMPEVHSDALREIRDRLREIKVVDPACGSGAFLVGMLKVLSGMLQTIHLRLGEPFDLFRERRRIIGQNLYGVDVKPWAVKICELRLWLTLVVEADEEKLDLKDEPLLPNLDYNILQGDSLVEEIVPGRQLVLRSQYSDLHFSPRIKRQITEIQKLKSAYYESGGTKLEIESKKQAFLRSFFVEEQQRLQREMVRLRRGPEPKAEQRVLDFARRPEQARFDLRESEEERAQREEKIVELEKRFHEYQRMAGEFSMVGTKGYFLWDLDFAEVLYQRDGFDVVIGNPPYVRQEGIAPPTRYEEDYDADTWRDMKREYKEKLIESVDLHWQGLKRDRKCDLYIYFYLHGLALVRPGGTFCFITSNSWLDVGYGAVLQKFLLENIEVNAIFDNRAKRSFASADVNTVISLFRRPKCRKDWLQTRDDHLARFVTFKKPFEICLTADNLVRIFSASEVLKEEDFRVYLISQGDLFQEGTAKEEKPQAAMITGRMEGKYAGGKWGGKYLRAPDIFFTILEKGKGKLVRLGDIAKVRRGFTTGANEFFYLNEEKIREWGIEEEFLEPVIKSPREVTTIYVPPSSISTKVFICDLPKSQLKGTNVLRYIEWGEKQKTKGRQKQAAGVPWPELPTVRGRERWYSLTLKDPSDFFCNRFFNDRFFFCYSTGVVEDQTFYGGFFTNKQIPVEEQIAFLNSTVVYLTASLLGRVGLGEGVLQYAVYEMEKLLVLSAEVFSPSVRATVLQPFQRLKLREIMSVEKEIHQPDRRALDDIIFDILGLTQGERDAVYEAVVELVWVRLEKARSV